MPGHSQPADWIREKIRTQVRWASSDLYHPAKSKYLWKGKVAISDLQRLWGRATNSVGGVTGPSTSTVSLSVMLVTYAKNVFGGLSGFAAAETAGARGLRVVLLGVGFAACGASAKRGEYPSTD